MGSSHTAHELVEWQHYMTHAEVDKLQLITAELPLKAIVVKIGAGAGTDTIAILETNPHLLIFSIDILAGESPATTNEHLRLIENGYDQSGCVIRIWGDSKIVGKRWPIPIDWLHIDGDHSFEGISGDILEWFRHLKAGGYISFHDYGDSNWPAVKEVVDITMSGQELQPTFSVDKLITFKKVSDE